MNDTEATTPAASSTCRTRFSADRGPLPRRDPVPHHLVTLTRPEVAALLADHGLRPIRALGQHFVVDPNTVRRIVRLAGVAIGAPVVEVGPGLGSLTLALLDAGAPVIAVEVDRGSSGPREVVAERR